MPRHAYLEEFLRMFDHEGHSIVQLCDIFLKVICCHLARGHIH